MTPFRFFTLITVLGLMVTTVSLTLLFSINAYATLQLSNQPSSVQSAGAQDRPSEQPHPPQVILNNPIFPEISEQFLREVFSGKMRHWPDGKLIKVVVSWFVSPILTGLLSFLMCLFVCHFTLNFEDGRTLNSRMMWLMLLTGFVWGLIAFMVTMLV